MADIILPPKDQFLVENVIRGGMDLLFFVNTRHLRTADATLAAMGLGRAHHRVLYFVKRRPDLAVNELLAILNVTKQSLARVTKDLVARKLLELRAGERDRRQRLLTLTRAGVDLENRLFVDLHQNMAQAYRASGSDAVSGYWTVLQHLIGEEGREQFAVVQNL